MKTLLTTRASIYYAMNGWHKVLKALPPAFGPRLVFLSVDRGDNIRLVIFSADEKAKADLSAYLTQFLLQYPSSNPEVVFQPGKSLWMNYENNTFQFNNFGILRFTNEDDPALKYCKALSNYIIQNVADEEITPGDILNHAIFLVINLIRLFEKDHQAAIPELAIGFIIKEYELSENASILPVINAQVLEDYPDNKETIHECYYSEDDVDVYLQEVVLYANQVKTTAGTRGEEQGWCFYLLINLLNNHLGITPGNGIYVLSLLNNYFKESSVINA